MAVNSSAPIIPGEGAASIKLGEKVEDILRSTSEVFVAEREIIVGVGDRGVTRYCSSNIDLWVKDDLIWQIMVHDGYAGKVLGKIGVGSTLASVEKLLGPVVVIADSLVVKGVPGVSFEPQSDSPASPITEIYVWEPDWVELRDHQTP